METQAQIEAHNKRMAWGDAANHLKVAAEALEYAQGVMDELDAPHISENLTPHVEAVARFQLLAEEKSAA